QTGDVRIDRSSRWSSRASQGFPPVRVLVRVRRLAIMPGWLSIPRMMRTSIGPALLLCLVCKVADAQSRPRMFAGVAAGIATLAADARSEIASSEADVSLYKPENGPALNIFAGSHVHEFLTVQGNYVWNRNDVTLTSVRATDS